MAMKFVPAQAPFVAAKAEDVGDEIVYKAFILDNNTTAKAIGEAKKHKTKLLVPVLNQAELQLVADKGITALKNYAALVGFTSKVSAMTSGDKEKLQGLLLQYLQPYTQGANPYMEVSYKRQYRARAKSTETQSVSVASGFTEVGHAVGVRDLGEVSSKVAPQVPPQVAPQVAPKVAQRPAQPRPADADYAAVLAAVQRAQGK